MISYLIDAGLFLALLVTTWRVMLMYKKLQKLSEYHEDYTRIFEQTTEAMDAVGISLQELRVRGEEILKSLGARIDDAREATVDISSVILQAQTEMKVLQEHIEWLKKNGKVDDAVSMPSSFGRGRRERTASETRARQNVSTAKATNKPVKKATSVSGAALLLTGGKTASITTPAVTPAEKSEEQGAMRVRKVGVGDDGAFRHVSAKDQDIQSHPASSEKNIPQK
ncbi:hypothetical protein [Polycladidibacter stylochi]|uniref:hypothetical protein n=1 Tax=Polycladidibacter stylochi TaxID=1807766 RepID=UPI000831F83B|nr:hypothetical protein [Pseudovibrio stylochi]